MSSLTPETRAETWAMLAEMRHELDALERRVSAAELLAVTVQHAARLMSLRVRDVRQAIANGALPAARVGHRIVVTRTDLQNWLDGLAQTTGGTR